MAFKISHEVCEKRTRTEPYHKRVQCSASVERMFNFAGHIFSNKRRRTGVKLFENLVFLKLNEEICKSFFK